MKKLSNLRFVISQALPEFLGLLRRDLPNFVYEGTPLEREVPVFSFHEVMPKMFRDLLYHLERNDYATIDMNGLVDHLEGKEETNGKRVVLTFDDGLSSAWTVATPLLREFGMKATLFVAPGTIRDRERPRKTIDEGISEAEIMSYDKGQWDKLVSWQEIDAMVQTGVWDIQSHTLLHARIWSGDRAIDFARPKYIEGNYRYHNKRYFIDGQNNVVSSFELPPGWPIYADSARMSGTPRFIPDASEGPALVEYVERNGGEIYFGNNNWRFFLNQQLKTLRVTHPGRWETERELSASIEHELQASKETIQNKTGSQVRHLLFPWEEGSEKAVNIAKECGYSSACWGVLRRRRTNTPGDDPFWIPRVSWKFLPLLPGEGRISLSEELMRRMRTRFRAMLG